MARTIRKNLDMSPGFVPPVIHINQYDSDFTIVFALYSSFGDFTLVSGTTAEVRGTKRSGTGYSADATVSYQDQTVTVNGDNQMTAVAGKNIYEIVLFKNGKQLSSINFILFCEHAALDADTITDSSVIKEFTDFESKIADATNAAQRAETAASKAENKTNVPLVGGRPYYGENGQTLRTKGNGVTEWASVGLPTDAQTGTAVSNWLDQHPEATTTVQDGALTEPKFSNALKLKTIKDYVTPEMYGAVGDGISDDTTAVQAAFDYVKNNGGYVLLKNKYAVSSTIKAYGEVCTTDRSRIKAISSMEYVVIYNPDQWRPSGEGQERTISRNVNVTLSVDANNLATYGIGVGYSYQNRLNLLVINAKTYGVNIGYITSGNAENYFNIYVSGYTLADFGVVGNGGDSTYGIIITVDCKVGIRVDGYMLAAHEIHCWLNDLGNFVESSVLQIEGGGNVSVRHFVQDTMQFGVINNSTRSTLNVGQYVISLPNETDASTAFINSADNPGYSIEITIEKYRMSKGGVVQSIFNYNESPNVQVSVREDPRQRTSFNAMPTQGIFTETIGNNICVVDRKSVFDRRIQTVYGVAGLSIREKVGDGSWTEKTIRYNTPRIERGLVTIPASSTNGWQTVTVTFDKPFTSAPYVVASHSSWNNAASAASPVAIKVTNALNSSFTVGYYGTNDRDIIVAWIAVE